MVLGVYGSVIRIIRESYDQLLICFLGFFRLEGARVLASKNICNALYSPKTQFSGRYNFNHTHMIPSIFSK